MENQDKNYQVIYHIIKYCEKIQYTAEIFCNQQKNFEDKKNYINRDVCVFYILQIGELTTKLTETFKERYNQIPWRAIKGMRNVVAHQYGDINMTTVWEVVSQEIPILNRCCKDILFQNNISYKEQLDNELNNEIHMNKGGRLR